VIIILISLAVKTGLRNANIDTRLVN